MGNNHRLVFKCKVNSSKMKTKKNCELDSVSDIDIISCKWITESDIVIKLAANIYEIKKTSGIYFKINKIGNFFITAAHCIGEEHIKDCVEDHDIAIYNTVNDKHGNEIWEDFKHRLTNGEFHNEVRQVGCSEIFKPGDSGLLCSTRNSNKMQQSELMDYNGFLLVSGGAKTVVYNGLLPKQNIYGSAGSIVRGRWIPRDDIEMVVFSGNASEMFGVKWFEFEKYCKISNIITLPYHILTEEEKVSSNIRHQFPDLVTEKIYDIKDIKMVKIPKEDASECHMFNLDRKVFSFHETENRFIFAVLPAFEIKDELSFKSGTPIFNAENNELISCVTKSHNKKLYPVSGIGWESGQIEKDKNWEGIKYHYVGKGESVYGRYHGPYSEVKKMATEKAKDEFGEKTGLGIYVQEKMVQIVTYDENGKERWRVRLFHEGCPIADSTSD